MRRGDLTTSRRRRAALAAVLVAAACRGAPPSPPVPAAASATPPPAEPAVVTFYRSCLVALGGKTTRSPVLGEVASALLATPSLPEPLRARGLSLGDPYVPGRINVLVPSGDTAALPGPCGQDLGFPTCRSHPEHGLVVCSPAMGRLLERPLFEPPISVDTQLAARYFVAVALGHELGHMIEKDRKQTSDLVNDVDPANLSCLPLDERTEELERRCDAHAAQREQHGLDIEGIRVDLRRLFALERIFDEAWVGDRLCLSNRAYDSNAARKQRFGVSYLQCLSPTGAGLAVTAEQELSSALGTVERALRAKQRAGWAGSPLFREGTIFSDTAVLTSHRIVVAAHSTGRASGLYVTRGGPERAELRDDPLLRFPRAASILGAAPTPDGARFFLAVQEDPPELVRARVSCPEAALSSCLASIEGRSPVPRGAVRRAPTGAWMRFKDARIDLFPDDGSFAAERPSARIQSSGSNEAICRPPLHQLSGNARFTTPQPERSETVSTGGVSAIASVDDAGVVTFCQAGLYTVELVEHGKGRAVFLPLPVAGHALVGLGLSRPRVALLMAVRDHLELWDCPETILAAKPPRPSQCTATTAPALMSRSIPEMIHDVSLLDAITIQEPPPSCAAEAWEVRVAGWTWLVERSGTRTWVGPGHGLAGCARDRAVTYRAGRIDELALDWEPANRRVITVP
jgi:hypothetical protein